MTSIRSGRRFERASSMAVFQSVRQVKGVRSLVMLKAFSPETGENRHYGIEFSDITYDSRYRHSIMLVEHPSG
jgi:hypothetical protein